VGRFDGIVKYGNHFVMSNITNIVFAGIGGQGVLTAANLLADVAFRAGRDIKQSEIHGLSQRGGSVACDVRFGEKVWSPMVPEGEADFLVVLDKTQELNNIHCMRAGGTLIRPQLLLEEDDDDVDDLDSDDETPLNRRNFNIALLGVLSGHLDLPNQCWEEALQNRFDPRFHALNAEVFALGRAASGQAVDA
jgi:indolepyruvate ferredoxin oxidoreductase beta subunit